jgi:hypothetical protein
MKNLLPISLVFIIVIVSGCNTPGGNTVYDYDVYDATVYGDGERCLVYAHKQVSFRISSNLYQVDPIKSKFLGIDLDCSNVPIEAEQRGDILYGKFSCVEEGNRIEFPESPIECDLDEGDSYSDLVVSVSYELRDRTDPISYTKTFSGVVEKIPESINLG